MKCMIFFKKKIHKYFKYFFKNEKKWKNEEKKNKMKKWRNKKVKKWKNEKKMTKRRKMKKL